MTCEQLLILVLSGTVFAYAWQSFRRHARAISTLFWAANDLNNRLKYVESNADVAPPVAADLERQAEV